MSERTCNFCGKSSDQVGRLVVCATAGICNECVALSVEVMLSVPEVQRQADRLRALSPAAEQGR